MRKRACYGTLLPLNAAVINREAPALSRNASLARMKTVFRLLDKKFETELLLAPLTNARFIS